MEILPKWKPTVRASVPNAARVTISPSEVPTGGLASLGKGLQKFAKSFDKMVEEKKERRELNWKQDSINDFRLEMSKQYEKMRNTTGEDAIDVHERFQTQMENYIEQFKKDAPSREVAQDFGFIANRYSATKIADLMRHSNAEEHNMSVNNIKESEHISLATISENPISLEDEAVSTFAMFDEYTDAGDISKDEADVMKMEYIAKATTVALRTARVSNPEDTERIMEFARKNKVNIDYGRNRELNKAAIEDYNIQVGSDTVINKYKIFSPDLAMEKAVKDIDSMKDFSNEEKSAILKKVNDHFKWEKTVQKRGRKRRDEEIEAKVDSVLYGQSEPASLQEIDALLKQIANNAEMNPAVRGRLIDDLNAYKKDELGEGGSENINNTGSLEDAIRKGEIINPSDPRLGVGNTGSRAASNYLKGIVEKNIKNKDRTRNKVLGDVKGFLKWDKNRGTWMDPLGAGRYKDYEDDVYSFMEENPDVRGNTLRDALWELAAPYLQEQFEADRMEEEEVEKTIKRLTGVDMSDEDVSDAEKEGEVILQKELDDRKIEKAQEQIDPNKIFRNTE